MQEIECLVYLLQRQHVRDVLVNLDFLEAAHTLTCYQQILGTIPAPYTEHITRFLYLVQVLLHQLRHLRAALEPSEGSAPPHAARHQLEGPCGDLLACPRDANDDGLPPTLQTCAWTKEAKQTA